MKKIYKSIFLVLLFSAAAFFQACETVELEQVNDPNNLTEGDARFLLNNIQTSYRLMQVQFNDESSDLTRIDYFFGDDYLENLADNTLNLNWSRFYSTFVTDIQAIEAARTEDNTLAHHLGMAKILQAHALMQLVDFLGDVIPLTNADGVAVAGNPTDFPFPEPTTDGGASSYNEAIALLEEAKVLLAEGASTENVQDLYYGTDTGAESDPEKWTKLANTLLIRAALTTSDFSTFNSLISAGNFIEDSDDDFEWTFGTQQAPIDTRHQDYQNDYTPSGANIFQSNWLMDLMATNNDPRIRYYFYRQSDCTPGASCRPAGNAETLTCSIQAVPPHIQGTAVEDRWCFLENGYWGRLHGDPSGTSPDAFQRTASGVYPSAGKFDDDSFGVVGLGVGGGGAGIEPIILASYVDFWRAEVAFEQGNTDGAADFIESGLMKSIAKVQSFGPRLDGSADFDFAPSSDDVTTYIQDIKTAFLDGDGASDTDLNLNRWNTLSEQYFTTLYGGGADAYNYYRRTGYPTTVLGNFGANPGNFPRTFLYPANEASSNPNITQRLNLDTPNFWNTQSLPVAN